MASEMERALDEILSGVHELLAKGPPKAAPAFDSSLPDAINAKRSDYTDAHADQHVNQEINPEVNQRGDFDQHPFRDQSDLIALLAAIESDPQHLAQAVAQRWLSRLLLARALPLGEQFAGFADITVSPIMHRAALRLAQTGARLVRCDAHQMIWDCGFSPGPALGRLAVTARRDQKAPDRLRSLPRMPERMPVVFKTAGQINFTASLSKDTRVALCDQDNFSGQASTIFWIEHGAIAPPWLCGFVITANQLVPLVNPRTQI